MSDADTEKAFTTAVLELLKHEQDFPYIETKDIQAATSLVRESYQGPLTAYCNFMLVLDELSRLAHAGKGHAT